LLLAIDNNANYRLITALINDPNAVLGVISEDETTGATAYHVATVSL